jgi:glutamate dehydrogenase
MTTPIDAPTSPVAQLPQVDELCEFLEKSHEGNASLLCDFAREFFAKVPRGLLQERSIEELASLTRGAFRFLERSRPDRVNVEVIEPEAEGWSAPVTVLRAELADRPFVVDTVREYLASESVTIQRFIHPVLQVERAPDGRVERISAGGEGRAEALTHCELARIDDPERREALRRGVEARLQNVVAATDDFRAMLGQVGETTRSLEEYAHRFPERAAEMREVADFLRWLKEGNFVFLGYRAYDIEPGPQGPALAVEPGSGLGILRHEEESAWARSVPLEEVPEELRRRVVGGPTLIVSKTNAESPIHRRARMDYIGVKKLDERGEVVGERRFLGLFTSKAYAEHAELIPILRDKLTGVLRSSGAQPGSHDYKEIITIVNSMPKEELFRASVAELEPEVQTVLGQLFADEVHVSLRRDPLGRGTSVMVILPRGRFSGDVRQRIQEALVRRLGGEVLNYHLAMGADDQARLHFYLSASADESARPEMIEREVRQIIRSWEDRLANELAARLGPDARRLAALYGPAFSEEYRAAHSPEAAVEDVVELERLGAEGAPVAITLHERARNERGEALEGVSELKLYLWGERLVLSDFMPVLDNAGLRVVEVTPFSVAGPGLPETMIYSFAVQGPGGAPVPLERADLLSEALLAIREGETANDPFNALVLAAGLRWREVDVLRTYANYAFQIGAVPTRHGPARALARHPEVARLLVEFFGAKFDPAGPPPPSPLPARGRGNTETSTEAGGAGLPSPLAGEGPGEGGLRERLGQLRTQILSALEKVATLADDRALRRTFALMEGTTRTNYFRHGGADPTYRSGGAPYISLKFRCADVEELRKNRLLYEVFVYSSRMEGIHLRAAPVSRGGIRWSDRPDDFRKEIMGLVQTQIVKNAVIVPSGSKGGFITKRAFPERESMMQEAASQYRTLMRGLLDITDNLVEGQVIPPEGVVRYDGDDPYLVVAADKGTAHLSDVANAVSEEYGFWLGDAFASGGSHGYDHKEEGITARGAWESVKRHFREMGKDVQTEPFTVVGIGDMSGDVFGNGMLLSRQIRLIAAFDHRNIFIDPDPDPEASYRERERLFQLPRSSWEDYDRSVLSPGAMILPRASKEVELTPEARRALGVPEAAGRLDGEALIRAVLTAPVELVWNGGIGTYVKDRSETNAEVGDSTNDPVRVNADELRCAVVGEGGNLGMTQAARIAYALRGGRLNTDALDNSAGVDMSDHEVNLKILLNPMVAAGAMSFAARNELLESMTDEVSRLVLHNNVSQSLAISLDLERSREALGDFAALITTLERERVLKRAAEGIPSSEEIAERAEEGLGLTRPTLCVLLAHAKLSAGAQVLGSPLPDDPATQRYLVGYFPPEAVEAVGPERLEQHRLRREIVTTYLINDLVDLMGSSFLHRVARDSGREIAEVTWAWFIASHIAGAAELRADLAGLEGTHPLEAVYRWLFGLARVLDRTTRWVLNNVDPATSASRAIEQHRDGLGRLRAEFDQLVTGEDRVIFTERMEELAGLGVDRTLAARIITLRFLPELLDILRIATEAGTDEVETARAYYLVSERLGITRLQQALRSVSGEEPWSKRLSARLLADVGRAHRAIAHHVLECAEGGDMDACLAEYEHSRLQESTLYREVLEELRDSPHAPLAGYAVAVRALSEMTG